MFKHSCIIDDDPICVFGIKKSLKEANFFDDIVSYPNGLEAIRAFEKIISENKNLPSIIFLDLNMPIMDGWDFLEDFKKIPLKNRENVRIYIVSSSVDQSDFIKAKSFEEVHDFFTKPITKQNINQVIEETHLK